MFDSEFAERRIGLPSTFQRPCGPSVFLGTAANCRVAVTHASEAVFQQGNK